MYLSLDQASICRWLWALVGAGHGDSDSFKRGCSDFLSGTCNGTQCNRDRGHHYLHRCFSCSPMHPSPPVGPAFKCCSFSQRTVILVRKVGFFTLCPLTPLRMNRKGRFCLPFPVRYSVCYPGEIQSSSHPAQDRVRPRDNHIMSGGIRDSDETPLSALQTGECHPREQAATFPA